MQEKEFKRILTITLIIALLALAFIIIRPILMAVIIGLILAYVFTPVYSWINNKIKIPNLSAFIIVAGVILLLLVPAVLLAPMVVRQVIDAYISLQKIDLFHIIQSVLPTISQSISSSADLAALTSSFMSKMASLILNAFQKIIFNFFSILLQTVIVLFTFFFMLRDHDKIKKYLFSISPFSKESQLKFIQKFEQVTNSILYGQLVVGILQGIIAGIGYFIFGVPNALLLTVATMLVGIIPVIGPWLVWLPVDVYLFVAGRTGAGIGLLIYCLLIVNWIDALIRPLIVSRMTKMNTAIALIGMIGGLYVFGVVGLILGPLILAYLILVAELYEQKKFTSILIENPKEPMKIPIL